MRMEPFTFLICKIAMIKVPMTANRAQMPAVWKSAVKSMTVTRVESEFTTIPAFWKPMKAMNRPIPTDTPLFNCMGMALKIASRTLVRDRRIKTRPSTKTASRAICQE